VSTAHSEHGTLFLGSARGNLPEHGAEKICVCHVTSDLISTTWHGDVVANHHRLARPSPLVGVGAVKHNFLQLHFKHFKFSQSQICF
jgi:hypothetical protein